MAAVCRCGKGCSASCRSTDETNHSPRHFNTESNFHYMEQALHGSSKVLHFITRRKQFLAASIVTFSTQHVTFRLAWALQNLKKVQEAVEEGNCCFGTIDTWLLYRLTKGAVHATDYSNASATGIFDSYQMCWSGIMCSLISLPLSIFPTVENTSHKFGSTDTSIFGVPIPIMSLVADQQAAMFGECCFDTGDVKITMGTGTFININTGNKPHTSISGLYPVVGWKIGQEVVYLAEGNAADTGTAIKWAQGLDLFSDAAETEAMANSVPDADGVCFVPSFSGLQAPLNDPHACASFMGLKPSTTKSHLVRAILESIAFRNKQLYEIMSKETNIPVTNIRSSDNFLLAVSTVSVAAARCFQVGIANINGDLKAFLDQNQNLARSNISVVAVPVSSNLYSSAKITLAPINVNVGPQMIISTPQRVQNSGNILIGSPYTPNSTMVTQSHITEASGWVPGKRMKKVGEKNGKGLRHFSMKVCEKVQKKGTTTYNEVADELVAEFTNSSSLLAADSLEKQKRMERIKQKRSQLQELILQQIAFKNLVQRNQRSEEQNQSPPPQNSVIQLPFILLNTSVRTVIDCSISSDNSNPELCANTEVALTNGQCLTHSSHQSSSTTTSHYSESRGETPCSFNDDDDVEDEDEDEDSSSPE
ncbi:UNVERIFIED_CONTAM: hypothetical protein FKN15_015302 [Acipenser sinensis]